MNKIINWYPGHMTKTVKNLQEIKKNIDLVIQVLDARSINLTSNNDLLEIFKNKKIINIAIKSDLSNTNVNDNNILYISKYEKNANKKIIDYIMKNLPKKNMQFIVAVIGLPNIGKSTLINILSKKNKVKIANKAGVTRNINLVKITNDIYLYDTPGVMVKRISTQEEGYVLSLLNLINKEILPYEEIIEWWFNYVNKNFETQKHLFFSLGYHEKTNYEEFISFIKTKFNLLTREKTLFFIYNKIINGELGKTNYDYLTIK